MIPEKIEGLKFGGVSLNGSEAIRNSVQVTKRHVELNKGVVVVVSAMEGVTDAYYDLIDGAKHGKNNKSGLNVILHRYEDLVDSHSSSAEKNALLAHTRKVCGRTRDILAIIQAAGRSSIPALEAMVLKSGEEMMGPIFRSYLREQNINAFYIDPREMIMTDGEANDANPDLQRTKRRIKSNLLPELEKYPVVVTSGYYASGKNSDQVVLLGRGGSDRSLTALLQALHSFVKVDGAYFYKEVPLKSADPKIVPSAHLVNHLLYEEAAALALLGGNILHPKAVHHLVGDAIEIYIKSVLNPDHSGTTINNKMTSTEDPIKVISALKGLTRLHIRGWGMDTPGISGKVTTALANQGVDITASNQSFSEQMELVFKIPQARKREILLAVKKALKQELRRENVESISSESGAAIGVIGYRVKDKNVLRKILEGLDSSIVEQSTGPNEVAFMVDPSSVDDKVRSMHKVIFGK